jgi:hypothetical protein
MSYADQARALAEQASDFLGEIHGVNQQWIQQMFSAEGMADPLPCYFTPVRDRQQLEEANMNGIHDTLVRIKKSTGFIPRQGQVITLLNAANDGADLVVRFDEFGHTALNPEFVIGCGNIL